MNARNFFVMLIVLYLGFTPVFAEENDISVLNQRIKQLEGQKEILEGQRKNLEESYKIRIGELDKQFDLNKQDIAAKIAQIEEHRKNLDKQFEQNKKDVADKITDMEKYQKTVDERLNLGLENIGVSWAERFLIFFGATTFGGVLGVVFGFFKLRKELRGIAEDISKKEFENFFHTEREKIQSLIEAQNEELLLKKTKSVVVLSKSGADEQFIRHFFDEMKFEKKEFETFDPSKRHDDKEVILLNDNDQSQKFDDHEIEQFAQNIDSKKILFYFGPKRISSRDNSNFANSKMQLYGNLMNALRYQKML